MLLEGELQTISLLRKPDSSLPIRIKRMNPTNAPIVFALLALVFKIVKHLVSQWQMTRKHTTYKIKTHERAHATTHRILQTWCLNISKQKNASKPNVNYLCPTTVQTMQHIVKMQTSGHPGCSGYKYCRTTNTWQSSKTNDLELVHCTFATPEAAMSHD